MSPTLTGVNISRTKDNAISAFDYKLCKQRRRTKGYLDQFFMLYNIYKASIYKMKI